VCRKMPGASENQRSIWWHWRDHSQKTPNIQRAIDSCGRTLRKIRQSPLSWRKWWPHASLEAHTPSNAPLGKLHNWGSGIRQIDSRLKALRANKRQTHFI
jgi:hypothetical protein